MAYEVQEEHRGLSVAVVRLLWTASISIPDLASGLHQIGPLMFE